MFESIWRSLDKQTRKYNSKVEKQSKSIAFVLPKSGSMSVSAEYLPSECKGRDRKLPESSLTAFSEHFCSYILLIADWS